MKETSLNNIQAWKLALIPAILAFFLYANTLDHQYALDDGLVLINNTLVQDGLGSLGEIFTTNMLNGINGFNGGVYRPTLIASFALEVELFGNNAFISHLFNVLYYALSVFVLGILMFRLFNKYHVLIPLSITLLFAVHPVHTEAVANIKGRDEIFAFLFSISSMLFFIKYIDTNKLLNAALGLLFFMISFISKESAITLIAVIPLMLHFFTDTNKEKIFKVLGALAAVTAILLWWHHHVISGMTRAMDDGIVSALNNSVVSTDSLIERLATGAYIQLLYVWKLIVPFYLTHDYSYNQIPVVGLFHAKSLGGLAVIIGLLFVAYKGLMKKDPISFGILFFFFTIITVANVLMYIGATFAERFLYAPSLGYAMVVGMLLPKLMRDKVLDLSSGVIQVLKNNKIYALVLIVLLSLYGARTIDRNKDWENNDTLFSNDVKIATESARIHYNWGTELYRQANDIIDIERRKNMAAKGAAELEMAVAIFPEYLDAWNNLGNCYKLTEEYDKAIFSFNSALQFDPGYSKAYYNGGFAFYDAKDYKNCITYLSNYLQLKQADYGLYYLIGKSYGNLGDFDNAITYLKLSLTLKPDYLTAMKDLGAAYGMKKDFKNSIEISLKAIKQDPNSINVLRNIAVGYYNLGDEPKYIEYLARSKAAEEAAKQK
ncbi:MAG: tetratricopeptide repeat protein [Flavobacteriales bacterium]|nr:tetratricopeptide repeat protein [Flavobacteriales bacterium]